MDKNATESLYQPLPGPAAVNGSGLVNEFMTEFIKPTSNAAQVMNHMKPVYIDKSNTFITEEERKKRERKHKKENSTKLTAREKRRLKIYDIPKEAHKFELFQPLAILWQEYMDKLLSQGTSNFEQKLIKADFHGASFTIVQSKNPSYIGTRGIVVQETLSMIKIITKENKLKEIPKNSSVFSIHVDSIDKDYVIYGQQFMTRPSERAVKKFKPRPSINL